MKATEYFNRYHSTRTLGIILCMDSAKEKRYIVTSSLIGWARTQNDP